MLRSLSSQALRGLISLAVVVVATTCRVGDLVDPDQPGVLTLNPLLFTDSAALGSTATHVVNVTVGGGAAADPLPFTVRTLHNSTWLQLSSTSGTAPGNYSATLNPAGLAIGTYRDTVEFTAGPASEAKRLPVEFKIVSCIVGSATMNGITTGAITTADCGAPARAGSFASLFRFSGTVNDSISVRVTSSAFDPYLILDTVPGFAALAENDNCPPGTSACLRYFRLPRTGDYVLEVTTSAAGGTGAFSLDLFRPRAPQAAATLQQLLADLVTTVATGGTVDVASLNLRGVVSDPDDDQVRLEVEVRPLGTAFSNVATGTSAPVASGSVATVAVAGLVDDGQYHWQARTLDATGRAGAWQSFGGNAETAADFRVSIPEAPAVPTSPAQLRSDATTAIAVGGTTDESTVLFRAQVSDPDPADQLRLEVEVRPVGTAFTNTASGASAQVAVGGTATATIAGLSDNITYHWQYRTVDQTGRASAWTSFGANAESATDFRVAVAPSRLTVTVQPTGTSSGTAIAPSIQVAAQDAGGTTLASFTGQIAVAIGTNPSPGSILSGTTTVTAVAGVATFAGLSIDRAGVGYTLVFSSGALSTPSNPFTITANLATRVVFQIQPPDGTAGTALSPAITVAALDGLGNVVTGFTGAVTIGIGTNAGGATLGGTNPVNAVAGVATFSTLTLNRSGTGYTLTASATGLIGATSDAFDIAAGGANRLTIVTQPAATAASGAALNPQPVIQLADGNLNPVAQQGTLITATIASGPAGGALINATATTGTNGQATFSGLSIAGPVGSYVLAFNGTGLTGINGTTTTVGAGAAFRLAVITQPSPNVASGAAFPQQPTVQVQDSSGNAVAAATVPVTATIATGDPALGGTTVVNTNVAGLASFGNLSITGAAGPRTLRFAATGLVQTTSNTVNVGSGTATTIALSAGNGQSALAGTAVATDPAVLVTDINSNPVAGVGVTFAVTGGGGAVVPLTPVITGTDGIATATSWTLGTQAGANTLTASATGLNGSPVQFTATGTVGAAATIAIFSGNNLTGPVNSQLGTAHEVLVSDANGNPVGGVQVSWAALGGGSVNPTQSTTDGTGRASTTRTLGPAAGPATQTTTATVTIAGTPTTVTFAINATVGGATTMTLNAGDNQTDTVGQALPTALSVLVTDGTNPVSNVLITWQVTAGGGSITPTSLTNASGIASATWTIGQGAGAAQNARATGVGTPVNFVATAVAGPVSAAQTSVAAAPGTITASSGSSVSTITVTARDQFNNPVSGKTAVLARTSGPATGFTLDQPAGATNASGVTAGSVHGTLVGTRVFSATVDGVAITQTASVTIDPGTPDHLTFVQQPSNAAALATIAPPVTVEIRDPFNNVVTGSTAGVTLAFGSNPGAATLGGTTTRAAVAGLATFNDLSVNNAGNGYTLQATSSVVAGGTLSGTFDIGSLAQTITFAQPASPAEYGSVFGIAPTATSGLAVSVVASGGCSIAGGDVTMTSGVTACTLTASQAGNGTYSAATNVVRNVAPAFRPASVTPNAAAKVFGTADPALTGTLIGFLAGDNVTATYARTAGENVGTYQINSSLSPAGVLGNYNITANTALFTITQATQTITFVQPASPATFGTTFAITQPTATSGLAVTVVATGGCTINGLDVTMTSGATDCTLTASQVGDVNFSAAPDVVRVVAAATAAQTITFNAPASPATFGTTFAITQPTATSNLAVIVVATGGCTITGLDVTMTSGTTPCTLTASQAGNADFGAAPDVVHVVNAALAGQTITFDAPASPATFGTTFAITQPTATSGLAVIVVATGGCTITGLDVTMTSGTTACTLTASQPGNTDFSAATDVVHLVNATLAAQSITFNAPASPATFGTTFAITQPTATSSLAVTVVATDGCTISGLDVTMTSGTTACTLTASQPGSTNYSPATDVVHVVNAALASQTIDFTQPTSPAAFSAVFAVAPTATSGLTVTVLAAGSCTILGGDVTMTSGGGDCTLTASQAGDANFSAAADVVRVVNASQASQTITFNAPATPATFGTTFSLTQPTATSLLAVTVGATGGCTITGLDVTMISGTTACTLTASQAGSADYLAATDVIHIVAAAKATQATVTLTLPPTDSVEAAGLVAVAGGGSGTSAFSYDRSTPAVCNVDVNTGAITALTPGSCTITATRATDDDFLVASSAAESFTITPGAPSAIERNSAATQGGTVGLPVGAAPSVIVRDRNSNPVDGASVTFTPANGGTVNGGAANAPVILTTAGGGIATLTSWTLGGGTGTQNLNATVTATAISIGFSATAAPGAPAELIIFTGDNLSATVGNATATPPTVIVEDAFDNRVPDASVTFTVTGGGGGVTGSPALSDGSGIAALGSWIMGNSAGPNTLDASVNGLTVTFHATGTAGAATQVTIATQPPDTAINGATFTRAPVLQLRDTHGNPVSQAGVDVTASVASGGGALGGTMTVATIADGTATFSDLTLTGLAGVRTLLFTGSGLGGTATSADIELVGGAATLLEFSTEPISRPSNGVAGQNQSNIIIVYARDAQGNIAFPFNGQATVTLENGPAGASLLSQTNTPIASLTVDFVEGEGQLLNVRLDSAGTGYTLRAVSPSLTDAVSNTFDIAPGNPAQATSLLSVSSGTIALGGGTVTVTLQTRDAFGNVVTQGGENVTFVLQGTGAGVSNGTLTGFNDPDTGSYTIIFTPTQAGTPVTVRARIDGLLVASSATIEVTP